MKERAGGVHHAQRLLAVSLFEPEQEMARIQFNRLLNQFKRQDKLLVIKPDARGQPGDEPVM